MKPRHYFFFSLFLLFFVSTTVEAQFQVKVKFGEIANLTYQLDCAGNLPVNCSAVNLSELWRREFLRSDEDRRMFREWKRLRELYSPQSKNSRPRGSFKDFTNQMICRNREHKNRTTEKLSTT